MAKKKRQLTDEERSLIHEALLAPIAYYERNSEWPDFIFDRYTRQSPTTTGDQIRAELHKLAAYFKPRPPEPITAPDVMISMNEWISRQRENDQLTRDAMIAPLAEIYRQLESTPSSSLERTPPAVDNTPIQAHQQWPDAWSIPLHQAVPPLPSPPITDPAQLARILAYSNAYRARRVNLE